MPSLHYLTVQDILWINLQVTKKVHHFNYAKLEEASFYQYAYGDSNSLLAQAARFLTGFLKLHPIDAGNEATAFVGCAAFLKINGWSLNVPCEKACDWLDLVRTKPSASELLSTATEDAHHHAALVPDVRGAVNEVLHEYSVAVDLLSTRPIVEPVG